MFAGLNLLRLLVANRIAEFHTELELIPAEVGRCKGLSACYVWVLLHELTLNRGEVSFAVEKSVLMLLTSVLLLLSEVGTARLLQGTAVPRVASVLQLVQWHDGSMPSSLTVLALLTLLAATVCSWRYALCTGHDRAPLGQRGAAGAVALGPPLTVVVAAVFLLPFCAQGMTVPQVASAAQLQQWLMDLCRCFLLLLCCCCLFTCRA